MNIKLLTILTVLFTCQAIYSQEELIALEPVQEIEEKTLILHPTSVDLSQDLRIELITNLSTMLATLSDLYLDLKQAHWNVKGPNFFSLHELFDTIAGEVNEQADATAERITALGGTANGIASEVASRSMLDKYPLDAFNSEDHLQLLIDRIAQAGNFARKQMTVSGDAGDLATADVYTDITRLLDKRLWFLQAHLEKNKNKN